MSASSERSRAQHAEDAPHGILRRGPDGQPGARWWPVTIIVVAGLIASGWMFTKSPMFRAKRIDVSGESHLSRHAVLRLAGLQEGANVFWLHTGGIEKRLEHSPWIAAADVTKSLPSTIRIEIRERIPVAQVRGENGFLILASDGTVLRHVTKRQELPALVFEQAPRHLGRMAWILGAMSPWLRERIHSVSQPENGSIVVRLRSGVPVYFHDASSIAAKDRALAAVLRWALVGDKPLHSIDVGAPLAPTARLDVAVTQVEVSVAGADSTSLSPGVRPSPSPSVSPSASPSTKASPSPSASPGKGIAKTTKAAPRTHRKRHAG